MAQEKIIDASKRIIEEEKYEVKLVIIPRLKVDNKEVSATTVRKLSSQMEQKGVSEELKKLVPKPTLRMIQEGCIDI